MDKKGSQKNLRVWVCRAWFVLSGSTLETGVPPPRCNSCCMADTLTPSNLEDLDHLFRDAYLPRKGQNHILSLYYIDSMQYHSSVRMCVFMYSSA